MLPDNLYAFVPPDSLTSFLCASSHTAYWWTAHASTQARWLLQHHGNAALDGALIKGSAITQKFDNRCKCSLRLLHQMLAELAGPLTPHTGRPARSHGGFNVPVTLRIDSITIKT